MVPEFNDHHIIRRSAGGLHEGTIRICIRCHHGFHISGWQFAHIIDGWHVLDSTGKVIRTHRDPPPGWSQAQMLAELAGGEEALERMSRSFAYLDQDGIEQVAEALGRLGRAVEWRCIGRLIDVVHTSTPWGSKAEAIAHVLKAAGIQKSRAYFLRQALLTLEANPDIFHTTELLDPQPGHILEVMAAPNPERAVALLADRLALDPFYPVSQFRAEARADVDSMAERPHREKCVCASCGDAHWRDRA